MFYLFGLSRNGKNYGSVDESNSHLNHHQANHQTLGSPEESGVQRENGVLDEEDPLLQHHHEERLPLEQVVNIDDAINRLGMGRFQYQVLLAAGLLMAADAIQGVLLSFLDKSQMESMVAGSRHNSDSGATQTTFYSSEEEEITDITMVVFPAALVGALVLGMLGDIIGRRPVFC